MHQANISVFIVPTDFNETAVNKHTCLDTAFDTMALPVSMDSSGNDPSTSMTSTNERTPGLQSLHGANVAVLQMSQETFTLHRAEHVSLATTGDSYGQELHPRHAIAVSRPPSTHSVLGLTDSITNSDITENSHPGLDHLTTTTHQEVSEPGHATIIPSSTFIDANVRKTPLPTYRSPTLPGKRLQSCRACTWSSAKPCFILVTCLRTLYYILFLGIPVFYRHRVHRIFKEVWLTTDEVMEKIIGTLAEDQARLEARGQPALSSAAYFVRTEDAHFVREDVGLNNLKILWESFIEQSIREWKTANLVSILLLSTIISTLQIAGALSDSIVRTAVLMSLICALMSLIYGCVYTVRFSTMRRVHKAFEWAKESEHTGNRIFWNTWILLAMPVTWLSWSLIFYLAGIMAFVWHAELGSNNPLPLKFGLVSRLAISCVLLVGVVYFVIIMITLNNYGGKMDGAWREKVRHAAAQRNIVLQQSFEGDIRVIPPTAMLHSESNV